MTHIHYKPMNKNEFIQHLKDLDDRFEKEKEKFLSSENVPMYDVLFEYRIANLKYKSILCILSDQFPDSYYLKALMLQKAAEDGLNRQIEKLTYSYPEEEEKPEVLKPVNK